MRPLVFAAGLSLLIAGTVTAASSEDAFLVDKRDFKKQFRSIALTPIDADAYLKMPATVAAILEEVITARLKKRGYMVIPSSVLAEIRKTMEEQVGNLGVRALFHDAQADTKTASAMPAGSRKQ